MAQADIFALRICESTVDLQYVYREVCPFLNVTKKVKNHPIMNIQTYASFYHDKMSGKNKADQQ